MIIGGDMEHLMKGQKRGIFEILGKEWSKSKSLTGCIEL